MPIWGWILVAAAAVIVLLGAWLLFARRRRSAALRQQFGPEYDRTIRETGHRGRAEGELQQRQTRHDQLELRSLSPAARTRYQDEWRMVQSQFVDDPAAAVVSADGMIQSVMRERGYPVEDFDTRADDLSVEHPDVVQNYREGHRLAQAQHRREPGSTEDLRRAMRHYRVLFEDLVGADEEPEPDGSTGVERSAVEAPNPEPPNAEPPGRAARDDEYRKTTR